MDTTDILKFKPEPLVRDGKTFADVNEDVSCPAERFPTKIWWVIFLIALSCFGLGAVLAGYMFMTGLGVLGLNQPVGWGVFIVEFVFWACVIIKKFLINIANSPLAPYPAGHP